MLRRLLIAALTATAVLILSGCSGYNYAGTGNRFVVQGSVIWSGPDSVVLDPITVIEAEGQARSFFNGEHGFWSDVDHREIHNNYSNGDLLDSQKYVGTAYNAAGNKIMLESLKVGQTVKATGRIRASTEGKSHPDRAVFDELIVVTQAGQ